MKKLITITFLTLLLLTQTFAQSSTTKGVETEYDRSKNKTTITVLLALTSSTGDNLIFGSIDSFSGKTRTSPTPDKVLVTFVSVSKQKQFSSSRSWGVFADDERIKLGEGEYISERGSSGEAELLLFALSVDNLRKIAKAEKVQMQVGKKEFTLTEAQLESLREYYKQISS